MDKMVLYHAQTQEYKQAVLGYSVEHETSGVKVVKEAFLQGFLAGQSTATNGRVALCVGFRNSRISGRIECEELI
ncbi:hypothetical protein E3J62_10790 [candidate division TA06 bacterium]|uniref:Uncharacterized protein n=1 Tax=candidate division TA06 bacterium TaxID=2250710 RepID=A0A523UPF8_UNCT6|nr:MAG: hypothetical protein E3J62_10790 [candidate division TA06 bacterium]